MEHHLVKKISTAHDTVGEIPGHIVDVLSALNNVTFLLLWLTIASRTVLPKRLVLPEV